MGCGCSKDTSTPDFRGSPALKPLPARSSSSRHSSARFSNVSAKLAAEKEKEKEKEREKERRRRNGGGMVGDGRWESEITGPIPKQSQGEQVAAGWPAWLSAVAGEAIKGWTPRRADSFQKLHKIGQGTYSNVYKARSLDSGRIVALKKVRFDNLDPESVRFMAREILILRRLDHPNVIKLEGLVTSRMSCSLYLVFEYMVHDLAGLAACPGITFTEPQVKCYMKQLFSGLEHSHSRGVLHRDIKGSNLLLDNSGVLKIADFGLATFYHPHQKQPLTSRVVTLWYRPPELLLGATEYGVGVDIWSTACILAELLAGKPIMPGRTEVEQLHKIFKLCGSPSEDYWKRSKLPHATIFKPQQPYKRCIAETFKDFPNSALSLLEKLLAIEPSERGDASSALKSEFFTTEPYACDPSSLPKYPPSKEMDAKMRDEAARRQRAAGAPRSRDSASKAVPAPQANAELQANLQRRRLSAQSGAKSKSEKFPEDSAIGFLMEPRRPHQPLPVVESKAISPSLRSLPPTSLSFRLDSMGNTVARKKGNGDDVCRAPSRPPAHSSAKSLSVSDFSAHSGDLSNLLSHTGSKSHIGSRGHVSVRLEGGTNRYGETESKRRDPDSKESHSRRSKRSGLSHEDISSID